MAILTANLEYLATVRLGKKGQLTVPKQFREDLGLRTGASFVLLRLGDGLILFPENRSFEQCCQKMSADLISLGLSAETILATLPEARKRVFDRNYSGLNRKVSEPSK